MRAVAPLMWRAVRQPGAERRQDAALVREVEAAGAPARRESAAVIRAKLENVHFHFEIPCQIARPIPPARPAPGRPREFDMEQALDRAVDVFSQRGYHGTSIGDWRAAPSWRRAACTRRSRTSTRCSWQRGPLPRAPRRRHGASHRRWRHRARTTAQVAGLLRRIVAGRAGRAAWWSRARSCRSSTRTCDHGAGRNEALLAPDPGRAGRRLAGRAYRSGRRARMLLCLVQACAWSAKTGAGGRTCWRW